MPYLPSDSPAWAPLRLTRSPRVELRVAIRADGLVDVRRWRCGRDGKWFPTRSGLRLTPAECAAVGAHAQFIAHHEAGRGPERR
jgi:hypothetical protein